MLTPTHLIELTDAELTEIRNAFGKGERWRSPAAAKLDRLPPLTTEDGRTYTSRGDQAVTRMLRTTSRLLTSRNPHAEDLRAALCRAELADAKLEVSVSEDKPGESRNAVVAEHMAASDALMPIAIEYAMAHQEEP